MGEKEQNVIFQKDISENKQKLMESKRKNIIAEIRGRNKRLSLKTSFQKIERNKLKSER